MSFENPTLKDNIDLFEEILNITIEHIKNYDSCCKQLEQAKKYGSLNLESDCLDKVNIFFHYSFLTLAYCLGNFVIDNTKINYLEETPFNVWSYLFNSYKHPNYFLEQKEQLTKIKQNIKNFMWFKDPKLYIILHLVEAKNFNNNKLTPEQEKFYKDKINKFILPFSTSTSKCYKQYTKILRYLEYLKNNINNISIEFLNSVWEESQKGE